MVLTDIYAHVRALLSALLQDSLGIPADACRIQCPGKFSPACSAAAKSLHADAAAWCERIHARLEERPVLLFGVPLIDTVEAEDGFLNFYFTTEAYDAIIAHMLKELPAVYELPEPCDQVGYAAWRMAMLARKGPSPMPDDPVLKKTMWITFGIAERLGDERLLALRKSDAAKALLSISRHLPPRERPAFQNRCGSLAECALRLLSL